MHIRAEGSVECPACKCLAPDTSQFCPQCGAPLTEDAKAQVPYKTPRWAVLVLILFFATLAYVGVHTYLDRREPSTAVFTKVGSPEPQPAPQPAAPQPVLPPPAVPRPRSTALTNGALTVAAGSYSYYPFAVPAGATNVAVSGHFTATGGSGNDIQVYILNDDGLANFKNKHSARTFYNSSQVTQATISAALPNTPGNYYLLFDNRFSPDAPKAIRVDATLTYTQ